VGDGGGGGKAGHVAQTCRDGLAEGSGYFPFREELGDEGALGFGCCVHTFTIQHFSQERKSD